MANRKVDLIEDSSGTLSTSTGIMLGSGGGGGLKSPIINIPSEVYGGQPTIYTITNYTSDLTYVVSANNGTGNVSGNKITWLFTDERGRHQRSTFKVHEPKLS